MIKTIDKNWNVRVHAITRSLGGILDEIGRSRKARAPADVR